MSSPVIEGRAFEINPEASVLHEDGLKAAKGSKFEYAHEVFGEALSVLGPYSDSSIDAQIQAARITRDDGFTYVRSAIKTNELGDLDVADRVIGQSASKTGPLAADEIRASVSRSESPSGLTSVQRRELYAEHGATINLLGRSATVRLVIFGDSASRLPIDLYKEAGYWLNRGNNSYYLVRNDISAATQERIDGNLAEKRRWTRQAIKDVGLPPTADHGNLLRSARTCMVHTLALYTRYTTVKLVEHRP